MATVRSNLIYNSSFENNVTDNVGFEDNLSAVNPTLEQDSTASVKGSASAKVYIPASAEADNWRCKFKVNDTAKVSVSNGVTYVMSAWIKSSDSRTVTMALEGSTYSTFHPKSTTTSWARYSEVITPNATDATPTFNFLLNDGNEGTIWFDGVMFEQASSLGTYFDGSSYNASWTGDEYNSPSVFTPGTSSVQGVLNKLHSGDETAYSEQEVSNMYNSTPQHSLSFQEVLNTRAGRGGTTLSAQEALFENLKSALGLSGSYTHYSEQDLLNLAGEAGLDLDDMLG